MDFLVVLYFIGGKLRKCFKIKMRESKKMTFVLKIGKIVKFHLCLDKILLNRYFFKKVIKKQG